MSEYCNSNRSPRRHALLLLKGLVPALAMMASVAAQADASLSKVFTPNSIGPGSVSTATFTITNAAAAPVTALAFTDVLPIVPGPMSIADPANASTDCDLGFSGTLSAPDGGSTITLSDAQLGGLQSCTVTVDVTASTPGIHTNPAVTLSSSSGSSQSLAIDLTVVTTLPGFSKSFAPSSVPVGDRSTLTFNIDNTANQRPVGNLDFTDNLPVGLEIADPANASTTCISTALNDSTVTALPGGNTITLDANGSTVVAGIEVLPAGGTCTVTVDVVAAGVGRLDNVTGDLLADFSSSGKASDTLEVTRTALALSKSFLDDPVPPGGSATLEFTINNFDRDFPATGITFNDDLATLFPALAGISFDSLLTNDCGGSVAGVGTTAIDFTGGSLAPQGSCSISVSLAIPASATPGTYTNTTGAVSATVDGAPVVGNMASDELFVESVPLLSKEFLENGTLAPDPVINAGDDVVLRFTVTNTSATSGATDIAFIDELTDGGPLTGFLPFPVAVTLPPTPCGAGSSLVLASIDTDRQGLSLTGGSLAAAGQAGDSCTFDVTLSVPVGMAPAIYRNTTGVITATVDGATRTGNPASDTLTVIAAPSLTKVFSDDPVAPGGTVTLEFTLEYPAEASGDASAIAFTDDLAPVLAGLTATGLPLVGACDSDGPGGDPGSGTLSGSTLLTFQDGLLSPGESCTISVTLDVPAAAAAGDYTNTSSSVSATVGGLAATSDPATDDLNIAGLTFAKEFLDDPVIAGDTTILRFSIDNIHPTDDASITFFSDTLSNAIPGLAATGPASVNTCGGALSGTTSLIYVGGSVLSGASCTIEVEVLVPAGAADGSYINITGSLAADQGGSVVINPATDTLVVNSTLLQLSKAFTDDPVAPGGNVTLEFTLTNLDATRPASGIDFSDDLGAALSGLVFDSELANTCGGTVSGTGTGTVTVSGVSLPAAATCTISASVTVPGTAVAGLYTNTTSGVTGQIGGFPVSGDATTDELEVVDLLLFSKSFDGPTTATGTAILTFTITNPGADTASGISFTDDISAVIPGLVASSLPALPCGAGSSLSGVSLLAFSGGELPPGGGTCSFDVEVLLPATAIAGTYPNTTSDLSRNGLKVADPATADLVVEPAPTFAKAFAPTQIGLGSVSTLSFSIDNGASTLAASSLAFSDNLPAGIIVATPSNTANTCGGTLTAADGSTVISVSGGSVAATASCSISVDVLGNAVGVHLNTTADLTSSSGNSGTASDTLTVSSLPVFSKAFAPDAIVVGGISSLSFSIDNTSSVAASAVAFSDSLPAGVLVASPPNVSNTCGGTLTATAGSGLVSLSGGALGAASSCTVQLDVTGNTPGTLVNTSGDLTTSLGNSGTASATLTVSPLAGFSAAFIPDTIVAGGNSTLSFTIDNTASGVAVSGMSSSGNLPPGLVVATPSVTTNTCGGTLTAAAAGSAISFAGGALAAGASCVLQIEVTSDTAGIYNLTSSLVSSQGDSGPASAALTVTMAGPGPAPRQIPTLNLWGLLLLAGLLGGVFVRRTRS